MAPDCSALPDPVFTGVNPLTGYPSCSGMRWLGGPGAGLVPDPSASAGTRSSPQNPTSGETRGSSNSPCPDFCNSNVAKYDLIYSRRWLTADSGSCSAFLRIMTPDSGGFWEKRYNRGCCGLRCTGIPLGARRSPGREIPTEVLPGMVTE
jgi:hypothetical protein